MSHWHNPTDPSPSFWRSKAAVALIMLLVIGAFYLLREHYYHASQALPYLPYLILLLCPLMHLFGHKHGGHAAHRDATDDSMDNTRK